MTDTDFAAKVAKGAELLDNERPGWADDIDLESLNMAEGNHCILGQLYGDYVDGLYALGFTRGWGSRGHGFTLHVGWSSASDSMEDWYTLHALWRKEVASRVGP